MGKYGQKVDRQGRVIKTVKEEPKKEETGFDPILGGRGAIDFIKSFFDKDDDKKKK